MSRKWPNQDLKEWKQFLKLKNQTKNFTGSLGLKGLWYHGGGGALDKFGLYVIKEINLCSFTVLMGKHTRVQRDKEED